MQGWEFVNMSTCVFRGQKSTSDPVKLEFQAVENPSWVLGTNWGLLEDHPALLTAGPSLQTLRSNVLQNTELPLMNKYKIPQQQNRCSPDRAALDQKGDRSTEGSEEANISTFLLHRKPRLHCTHCPILKRRKRSWLLSPIIWFEETEQQPQPHHLLTGGPL